MQTNVFSTAKQLHWTGSKIGVTAIALVLGLSLSSAGLAQDTVGSKPKAETAIQNGVKKMITHDVYATWRSIQTPVLSRDGIWAAYALHGQESDGEVVVKNLQDGREWRSPRGITPVFTSDGNYLVFAIAPTRADLDKAKKEKKKPEDAPKPGVGFMDLATGKVESLERVKKFSVPEEGGNFLAVLLEAVKDSKKDAAPIAKDADDAEQDQATGAAGATGAAKKKEAGTELLVWDLVANKKHSLKDVADFVWNKSGSVLAYSVSVKEPAREVGKEAPKDVVKSAETEVKDVAIVSNPESEGVYVFQTSEASSRALLSGAGSYKHLRFDDEGKQLAFLTNRDDQAKKKAQESKAKAGDKGADIAASKPAAKAEDKADTTPAQFALYLWTDATGSAQLVVDATSPGMPLNWAPSEHADLVFSKDGQRLFLSTAEVAKPDPKNAPEPMKVDLWHWKDPELQSVQKVNAERDKQRNYRAVVHLSDRRFIQLANKNMPQLMVNENAQFALGISSLPYRHLMSWDKLYYDAYAVDLRNGQSKMLIEKAAFMPQLSPAGKFLLSFDGVKSQWWTYDTSTGKKQEISSQIKTRFEDQERDTPDLKPPYGVAGWTENDATVVLYDQFDLWSVNLADKASKNLTSGWGKKNQTALRYVYLGDNKRSPESKALPSDQPWLLSAEHDVTHATGYYQLDPKQPGAPSRLIYADKLISNVLKAKDSDRILFTQQSFTEFPDLWSSRLNFAKVDKISQANPQQEQFNWGTQEQIEYVSADGKKLKALIAKPENFDPKKKYPMMVYIYEKMTDNLHRYVPPSPAQNINVTRYVSNGYIVLRPDIVYTTGYPGKSALNTVLPAVKTVLAQGYVDPKRVGIQGHSWGAYQINYLLTRTDMFRAAEAGASMANMVSGYGGIRWGAGVSRAFQYERGQSRIGGTPWDSTSKYVENSPIFQIDKVKTPYLTVHNDDDDAVPWYQAIEFFSALRRLNKEAYWFNYNGEKHGLRDRDNIKHFTVHMGEFFDHYLLGKARPEWMDKPVPYLERGKRDVMGMFKTPEAKPAVKADSK
ncbi:prolyl oligopeptidase family serine peptidase [Undibacterium sp. LX40W]|uniref:Prolyl oligopeptidase family serine peptidase n=1 Tax=Undibacterium nitidum TaxID=2762298 RepID=A0A923HWM2_9BURK|nr:MULTISPECIES: prolyl oligopeptidase family serine peptidase [Undibacterium]MBC3881501.1 prolyl oligopeptidase family serine peptidase [Undibacterium nitidum]MBC3891717.1 prolyl oligopeptidase family serine peptidase [Undibacterium sp. LX40W]